MQHIEIDIKVSVSNVENIKDKPETYFKTIPFDAPTLWMHVGKYLAFVYHIDGQLFIPKGKEIKRFRELYGVKGLKPISEFMKGERVELYRFYR